MSENNIVNGFRLAHTMLRVLDLEISLKFYCDILGMKVLRRTDYPEGRFTNTSSQPRHPTMTWNWWNLLHFILK